ncbi:GTP cyclohydrolase I FolE [Chitinophaga sp. Ak27]|uniref:GTP cyclohydrolase I FolE n=1 Tax=Chitinophaga sp. Ak27 TaxID=2726116 RepID=UPI00145EC11B|nr:GTP cyclohydrolase I FolE [Chitinophaga sp. Ak27]NLU96004.1 GTP cyclohydrolase I FolE [Chitinophaga sp. Ak27]
MQTDFAKEPIVAHSNIALTSEEKIKVIRYHFREIMLALGLDLEDDSLKDTPGRVAKMFVNETFLGLNPVNEPSVTLFENKFKYNEIVLEKDIPLYSYCEHHFVPIIGKVHIAYISKGMVIGLSKLNRITEYFAKRPQVQERLTIQIAEYLKQVMAMEDVAVIIKAEHLCVASRGVNHTGCATVTQSLHGQFLKKERSSELYSLLAI